MKRQTSMSRLQTWLTYLFIFLLPIQVGTFFFIPQSYISGIRIDYLAPSLYLTDIIALFLIFTMTWKRFPIKSAFTNKWVSVGFLLVFINILFALESSIAIYKYVKLVELICIYLFLKQIKLNPKILLTTLFFSTSIQLLLVALQLTTHGSLQGIWYFLGERSFSLATPGLAKITMNGVEMIRGYGTFSHPNSLAGFYLLLYGFVLFYRPFQKFLLLRKGFLTIATLLILLSFSKIAILGLLIVSFYSTLQKRSDCLLCKISQMIIPITLGAIFLSGVGDPESIEKRIWLASSSFQIIREHLLGGVGLGNYLIAQSTFSIPYPYFFLQPVHNIFLLAVAELGIPLFILIMYLLKSTIQTIWKSPAGKAVIIIVVLTGLFDHYWLTLQQNMLLVPVVFGLLTNNTKTV